MVQLHSKFDPVCLLKKRPLLRFTEEGGDVATQLDDVRQIQGCQMVYFQTKNPTLGKFWKVLQWKILVHFMDIWSILLPFGIFYSF
jgi:hypothetical protein